MAFKLKGNWKGGLAFDHHTLSSSYLGVDEFGHGRWDNTRSEMGELVYQLKYREQTDFVAKIVELLDRIKGVEEVDRIVPIPPSVGGRRFQPVRMIAESLGKRRNVEVLPDLLRKSTDGPQLKDVADPSERRRQLTESMKISEDCDVAGLRILLIDDLFRSGATLSVATDLLMNEGRAAAVYVLTMTKTRTNR